MMIKSVFQCVQCLYLFSSLYFDTVVRFLNSCWYDWGCYSSNYEGTEASTTQRSRYRGQWNVLCFFIDMYL